MSNIYLKVAKKDWLSQNFDFLNLKKFVTSSVFWGAPAHEDIIKL